MATRLINRSDATMDVLAGTAGGDRIIRIEPGKQNHATVTPKAVKPTSGLDRLMGGNEWLEILTDTAIIYEWGFSKVPFTSYASLHCVPFTPAGIGPYDPGYRSLAVAPSAPDHPDPQPVEDAPPADAADGEFDMSARDKNPFLFFGEYVRTKLGATTYITVRLNLRRLAVSEAQLNNIKPIWKDQIETVWNSGPALSNGQSYRFEVDWTDRIPHSSVFVLEHKTPLLDWNVVNMFTWALNMGKIKDSDLRPTFPVAAHEFGHHIGLSDAYFYRGEIPGVADAMVKHSPKYRRKNIKPTFWTTFAYFFGLNPVTAPRAEDRIRKFDEDGQFQVQNLMTGAQRYGPKKVHTNTPHRLKDYKKGEYRAWTSAMDTVDQVLIKAIEEQKLQPLRLDENEFQEKQTVPGVYDGYFTA